MLEVIEKKILSALPNANVDVRSDDNVHFQAIIVSEQFDNLSSLERQKLIYQALNEEIKNGKVHAISLKTYTPNEWEKKCIS